MLEYLIATWGVNHAINPLLYIKQLSAQIIPIQPVLNEETICITVHSLEEYPYLLLNVAESDQFFQTLSIQTKDGTTSSFELCKGMNCIDMRPFGESIFLSQKELAKYNITLSEIDVSNTCYINIRKTLSIFVSFTFFFAFLELVQWIKKRYIQ